MGQRQGRRLGCGIGDPAEGFGCALGHSWLGGLGSTGPKCGQEAKVAHDMKVLADIDERFGPYGYHMGLPRTFPGFNIRLPPSGVPVVSGATEVPLDATLCLNSDSDEKDG